jgi:hypothetical protein
MTRRSRRRNFAGMQTAITSPERNSDQRLVASHDDPRRVRSTTRDGAIASALSILIVLAVALAAGVAASCLLMESRTTGPKRVCSENCAPEASLAFSNSSGRGRAVAASERDDRAAIEDLKRTEDPELHLVTGSLALWNRVGAFSPTPP